MKDFFKYLLATIVGFIIANILLFFLSIFILGVIVTSFSSNDPVEVKNNSVLYLNLDQNITERTPVDTYENLPFIGQNESKSIGFTSIINGLKKAQTDDRIRCVYINVSAPNAGFATLKEVRDAIIAFRSSNKKVYAYSEVYTQGAYYLASAADKVYLNPQGILEFKGFSSEIMFFKGALDKLGIEAQIIRVGNYKSAVEPYINTQMSDYNRAQVNTYVNGLYNVFIDDIAQSRNITADSLKEIANNYLIREPEDAIKYKMIDGVKYKDEILADLKQFLGVKPSKDITQISINDYTKNVNFSTETGSISEAKKIAVIYANGEINGGEGSDQQIGSERISRTLRRVRLDTSIKAVVLRINSPGGSALASDVIWREVLLTKKVKPVIASFGDVAASGGYYIGCAADSIFVQPNTLTGSIGVFGIIPNLQNLLNNKLGITFDGVKTGPYADIMSITRPLTPGEKLIIQQGVNKTYDTFLTRVANGRSRSKNYIDSIGGGHVWTGADAVKIGLADKIGNFNTAIKSAARKANIKNYRIVEYPEQIDPWKSFLSKTKDNLSVYFTKKELGESYLIYKKVKEAANISGIQARMLYEPVFK